MPVRNAAGNVSRFARMQLLQRMPFYLRTSEPFLAQQDLAAFVGVPLGASASLEMDSSRAYLRRLFPGRFSGEVGTIGRLRLQHEQRG